VNSLAADHGRREAHDGDRGADGVEKLRVGRAQHFHAGRVGSPQRVHDESDGHCAFDAFLHEIGRVCGRRAVFLSRGTLFDFEDRIHGIRRRFGDRGLLGSRVVARIAAGLRGIGRSAPRLRLADANRDRTARADVHEPQVFDVRLSTSPSVRRRKIVDALRDGGGQLGCVHGRALHRGADQHSVRHYADRRAGPHRRRLHHRLQPDAQHAHHLVGTT